MTDIFKYMDYRDYLRDTYEVKKKESRAFSYRYLAGKLGLNSSFLIRILQKKSHLPVKIIPSLSRLLQLKAREAAFLQTMVLFNRSKTDEEARTHLEKLLSLKKPGARQLDQDQYEYYQKWYYAAVRLLLDYYPFSGDFDTLGKQLSPPISAFEARKAVQLLEKLGMIRRKPDGNYEVPDQNITTGKSWSRLAVRKYQEDTIRLAAEALNRVHKSRRNISTLTMNISTEDLEEIDRITCEYREALSRFVNSRKKADAVYQLNIQFFPLTRTGA